MRIIDSHVHIIEHLAGFGPRGELRALGKGRGRWATGEETQFIPPEYGDKEFTAETLISLMKTNNIEKAVILQGALYGFQNDYTAEAVRRYPEQLVGAGTLDPYCLDAVKIVDHFAKDFKFKLLKFEVSTEFGLSGYHIDFRIDGKEMELVWDAASQYDMTVVFDIGSYGTSSFQTDAILNVAGRYKNLRIVIAHLFLPSASQEDMLIARLKEFKGDNIWFDIASLPVFVQPEPYPYPTSLRYLTHAKKIAGAHRLIWGSDIPMMLTRASYAELLNYICDSGVFNSGELEGILYNNAVEAFRI